MKINKMNRYGLLIGLVACVILFVLISIVASEQIDYPNMTKWAISGLIGFVSLIIISLNSMIIKPRNSAKMKYLEPVIGGIVLCMISLILFSLMLIYFLDDDVYRVYIIENAKIGYVSFPFCIFIYWLFTDRNNSIKFDAQTLCAKRGL